MTELKNGQALLVGRRSKKVKAVEEILKGYSLRVETIPGLDHFLDPSLREKIRLILLMDSRGNKFDKECIRTLRHTFPRAKILSLVDRIAPEMEMEMRSAGLVFLGSYEHFKRKSGDIIDSVFG